MRPMRLFKREVKDIREIETILKTCDTVRIGAADEDGIFVVPMNYGYELVTEDAGHPILKIYVHSAYEGRKAEAFKKDRPSLLRWTAAMKSYAEIIHAVILMRI